MITLLNLIFAFNLSFSAEAPFPKNWCNTGKCSTPQEKIWSDFNKGGSPSWSSMPQVVSGSCYHSSRNYNNKTEHFSGFIIDTEREGFSFHGRHSFFAKENPYKNFDLEIARESFKKESSLRIDIFNDYGFYNANPEAGTPIRYWFREGEDGNLKMAVVFGTLNHFILCDLKHHQN